MENINNWNGVFHKKTRDKLRFLQRKNNYTNLFYISFDWLIIAGAFLLSQYLEHIVAYLVSVLVIASRQRAFDNLTHEASHGNLLKHPSLNKWISWLFVTFPIFTSLTAYRKSHFIHHRYLSEENDPDLQRYKMFGLDNPPSGFKFILLHVIRPLTSFHAPRYIYGTLSSFIYSKDIPLFEQKLRFLYWAVIITVSIQYNFWDLMLLYWLIPYMTVLQIIRYFAEMSEHAGLMKNEDPLLKTRNVFGNTLFLKFMYPHHDHYHLVHHLFPGIPHYNLPKAHAILMEEEEYCKARHCIGYFFSPVKGFNSVINDIRAPHKKSHHITPLSSKEFAHSSI